MRRSKAVVTGAVVAAVAVALAGCGTSAPSEGDSGTDSLLIYTSRAEPISEYVVEQFEAKYPEYAGKVEVLTMGAAEIPERVRAEKENPQASLWWGGTQQALSLGADDGLLEAWSDPSFKDQIDPMYRDADDRWFAEYQLPQVIVYNNEVLDADSAPQDWDDLIDPEWRDKIIIRDVAASGGMRSIWDAMILRESPDGSDPQPGYDYLTALDANTTTYAADPADLYLQLSRQSGVVSLWNLQDTLIQIEQNNMPFDFLIPSSGTPVLVDGLGIVADGPNTDGGKLFAEFLYDVELRSTLAEDYFQIPVTEIKAQPSWLADLDIVPLDVDWAIAAEHEAEWVDHWLNNIKNK
ncbi:extracellular solute-binding protein [Stackebrandtia soli]|uniref:extracellular solute-binding protein n=1 Tax=Stackebrandtia soli TaxID=1892856 RepID=UPI0039E85C65